MFTSSRLLSEDTLRAVVAGGERGSTDQIRRTMIQTEQKDDEVEESESTNETTPHPLPDSSKKKAVPSFFSRTYSSWSLLTEKMNVYTPVFSFLFTRSSA